MKKTNENLDTELMAFDNLCAKVSEAQKLYAEFTQEQVDTIFKAAALAANDMRIPLAKMAVEETGMGIVEDKVIKNHFAAEFIFNKYKNCKTVGVIEEDKTYGVKKIADPIGVLAGIIPTTNPTSTAIFKTLLALKTRNAIIISPHPRAKLATIQAAKTVLDAAVKAGAPEDIIAWIEKPSLELTNALMKHDKVNMILATGGPGMVKAAYSSGKPALGVGAGNTPAIVEKTADIKMAVNSVILSKTFDNGVICASEQAIIAEADIYDELKEEMAARGVYILNKAQKTKVGNVIFKDGRLNAAIVGQRATKIAELAGIKVPANTKILTAEVSKTTHDEVFAHEKLSPVLALYKAADYDEAVQKAVDLIALGGMGHTSVLYTDPMNAEGIAKFEKAMKTGRVLLNMPASHGAIGDIYNFKLEPSLTLGCGSWGGNAVSENVGVKHLLNVKTVAERKENMLWYRVPPRVFFKRGCLPIALSDLAGKKRALIVTDKPLYDLGYTENVEKVLADLNIDTEVFYEVEPDPTVATVNKGKEIMSVFKPDVIIALGGGSPIDAAKVMWLMYEDPEADFEGLAMRFMDIEKRIYSYPELGKKARFIAIPTTSGTGSEVTPFAVITDQETGAKYPLADYALTPDTAIIDPDFVMSMPPRLAAYSGVDAVTHALEAIVSVVASDFTNGQALEALKLLFEYLPRSYKNGDKDPEAREKVHYAATLAGMAFANAFLGICHSMAHKMGAAFHIPHGLANALLINEVIKYNAVEDPDKMAAFSMYKFPQARERYAKVADYLGLGGTTVDAKVKALIKAIDALKKEIDIPKNIKASGVEEADFMAKIDDLAEHAFDDQCTGANPVYPAIADLKEIYIKAYK
jgi:acetaldehyde dehydrogenase / alcohol dehydrogenase